MSVYSMMNDGKSYSPESFKDGDYRMAKPAGHWHRLFGGEKVDWLMKLKNYDLALESIVKLDMAGDVYFWYLGEIAEDKEFYDAAIVYYETALQLTMSDNPGISSCGRGLSIGDETALSEQYLYEPMNPCRGLNFVQYINERIAVTKNKASGNHELSVVEYDDGGIYVGPIDEIGRPSGWGELTFGSGDYYHGFFSDGQPSRYGTMNFRETNLTFHGSWDKGAPVKGKLYNPRLKFGRPMLWNGETFAYFDGDLFGEKLNDNGWFLSATKTEVLVAATNTVLSLNAAGSTMPMFGAKRAASKSCKVAWGTVNSKVAKPKC
jgi:hypothetical protein